MWITEFKKFVKKVNKQALWHFYYSRLKSIIKNQNSFKLITIYHKVIYFYNDYIKQLKITQVLTLQSNIFFRLIYNIPSSLKQHTNGQTIEKQK